MQGRNVRPNQCGGVKQSPLGDAIYRVDAACNQFGQAACGDNQGRERATPRAVSQRVGIRLVANVTS